MDVSTCPCPPATSTIMAIPLKSYTSSAAGNHVRAEHRHRVVEGLREVTILAQVLEHRHARGLLRRRLTGHHGMHHLGVRTEVKWIRQPEHHVVYRSLHSATHRVGSALFANWPVRPLLENAHARKRAQNAIEDVGVRVRVSREIGGRQRAGCQPVGKLQLRCRVERCRRNVSGGNLKNVLRCRLIGYRGGGIHRVDPVCCELSICEQESSILLRRHATERLHFR
jgi:hypothetical protein